MKDEGLDKGLIQQFETSDKRKGNKYGFRKMFWKYLGEKLNVPFYDACCATANGSSEDLQILPLRYNSTDGVLERFNGTAWIEVSPSELTLDVLNASSENYITSAPLVMNRTGVTVDVTAVVTADQLTGGLFTSTSAAAVSLTLPTATLAATALGAARGTTFDFIVDNGVGADTVTVVAGSGMTASSALTGGTTLTVATGVVGQFRLYFQSGTTAKLSRIA